MDYECIEFSETCFNAEVLSWGMLPGGLQKRMAECIDKQAGRRNAEGRIAVIG